MSRNRARVLLPNRKQMELRASDLESLLSEGHRARLVWAYVERQDLQAFYQDIRAVDGGVGRSAIAPEILLALWLYATLDGVGSAREIARLTDAHDAYRWLCGGVQVNYHTLSDFRKDHGEALDELLSVNVAALMDVGVVKLHRVAQDGMRVRAGAGAGSFRRKEKLEGYLEAARAEVARLKAEVESDPSGAQRAREAARQRAAEEREARLEKALARLPEIEAIKKRNGKSAGEARVLFPTLFRGAVLELFRAGQYLFSRIIRHWIRSCMGRTSAAADLAGRWMTHRPIRPVSRRWGFA